MKKNNAHSKEERINKYKRHANKLIAYFFQFSLLPSSRLRADSLSIASMLVRIGKLAGNSRQWEALGMIIVFRVFSFNRVPWTHDYLFHWSLESLAVTHCVCVEWTNGNSNVTIDIFLVACPCPFDSISKMNARHIRIKIHIQWIGKYKRMDRRRRTGE